MRQMRIINIGSIPPPFGGVTCFLKRLKERTDRIGPDKYIYYDVSRQEKKKKAKQGVVCTTKIGVFFKLINEPKASYVIFHSNSTGHLLLQRMFQWRHKFIYFTHGESILRKRNQKGWRYRTLMKSTFIVTPTEELYKRCSEIFGENKVKHIPFILFPENVKTLKNEMISELRSKTDFLICGYACHLNDYKGVQLYGTDMMIKLIYELRKKGYNVGCICLISDNSNQHALTVLRAQIKKYNIDNYFKIWDRKIDEAITLYKAVDLYVRPTNTDGDSFSIWEALYVGTPVLTSDVIQRPKGCILFKTRSDEDFLLKGIYVIDNYGEVKKTTGSLDISGSDKRIIEFFSKLK